MGSETPHDEAAIKARQHGNDLYKQGKLREAEEAYLKAFRLAPDDARPLSNLAAVYYELAEYSKCADTCRESLTLLDKNGGEDPLADKIRVRLFKALLFSHETEEAKTVLSRVTSEGTRKTIQPSLTRISAITQSPTDLLSTRKKILDRVARYRAVLQDEPEYYSVGHDEATSFFTSSQLKNKKGLASLCCGIGDARLLFATIMMAAPLLEKNPSKKFHFTLVDKKPAVFARDLIIFHMLFDLDKLPEEWEEINVTIAYVFAGQFMPPWAFKLLQQVISELITLLRDTSSNVMDIFYIPGSARQRIIRVLEQWQQPPKPSHTTAALRRIMDNGSESRAFGRMMRGQDEDPVGSDLPPGCSMKDRDMRRFFDMHIMVPPAHLLKKVEPRLLQVHKKYDKSHAAADRKALDEYINSCWHTNVTVIDSDFEAKREDSGRSRAYPHIDWHPVQVLLNLYASIPHQLIGGDPGVIPYLSSFFGVTSTCLGEMGDRLVIEVTVGEMHDALERLRYGILRDGQEPVKNLDPSTFPNQFDKIDMSNIPDYVGGALTTFLHGVPLLRQRNRSLLRSYVLRNTPVWITHNQFLAEHLVLGDREKIQSHFRTTLTKGSMALENFASGQVVAPGGFVMAGGFEWERTASSVESLPASERMSRPDLEHWLHAHFLKLCLPYRRVRYERAL